MKSWKKQEQDRHISSHDIGKELNHKTVLSLEIREGWIKKKKNSTFGCHMDLTVKNLVDRISICESLLKRNEIEPVLKRLIMGDEK